MSTISDALKDSREAHFLLQLDFGGLVRRYAMQDLIIPYSGGDDVVFECGVMQQMEIGSALDLNNWLYTSSSVTIHIANQDRLHYNQ